MARFNRVGVRPNVTSPVRSESVPSGRTYEGGAGYARDARSELFLLAVSNLVGEHTFYESADRRDLRYAALVAQAATSHPVWTAGFLRWLRTEANLRTAALVGAAEYVRARLTAGPVEEADPVRRAAVRNRAVIDSVLLRADEPGEMLAYWTAVHGRAIPQPVKRGVADAATRLYDERSWLKWDSAARGFRFADVLDLTHPTARSTEQSSLFRHILDDRHGHGAEIPLNLVTVTARAELMAWPTETRRELFRRDGDTARTVLRRAGMTWEALAGWLQGPMDAAAWEAMIPSMGYMALLRNLGNFDRAGVSDEVAAEVAAKLADPERVARSRQFPMRFLSAHRAAPSLRWSWALERATGHTLSNVPRLSGRTLVLVDTSGSMRDAFSRNGSLLRWDAAALFGIALGSRCAAADVVSFSNGYLGGPGSVRFPLRAGESLLTALGRWCNDGYFIGAGTDAAGALRRHFAGHDRVVILTDEQAARGDVGASLPDSVPLYTWNLAGYRLGHAPSGSGRRHTFGGLGDQAFRMIPLLEAGRDTAWDSLPAVG